MDISKTLFKRYAECENIFSLDQIHRFKFENNYDNEKVKEMLMKMFDENGEDQIDFSDEQIEVMLPYYQKVEEIALKEANIKFNKPFVYYPNTLDQKSFSFKDNEGNNLYTYLDGYYEDDNEIIIIEVKASTDSKILKLGPKVDGIINPIFEKENQIIKIKKKLDTKQIKHLNKIYDKKNDIGKYFYDLAITNYIIKNCNLKKNVKYYLAFLNSKYIFDGSFINGEPSYYNGSKQIISFVEATDLLDGYYEIINNDHKKIQAIINDTNLNKPKYKKECKECVYKNICFDNLNDKYLILNIMGAKQIKKINVIDYYNQGIQYLKEINFDDLENERQQIQYQSLTEIEVINKDGLKRKINEIKYPIYHLDFEAFNGPLPRFFGEKPYAQSLFQYSIHIERLPGICDKFKDNYSFVASDFSDRREELVKNMIDIIDLSNGGTVLVYNKTYESSRIIELIGLFPQYKDKLQKILDNIYDLKDVLDGGKGCSLNYYHRDMEGKYSIKKVLPVLSNLSYKDLNIHNGVEAIINYAKFRYLEKEDIEELRKNLIEYCGLDTYSMFVILEGIKKKI